jgi:hypothetical protein
MNILIKEHEDEKCWKFKDGSLVPISKLSPEQLKECLEKSTSLADYHNSKLEIFMELTTQLDAELASRKDKLAKELEYLEGITV